jgi:serine/threonine protein kinase
MGLAPGQRLGPYEIVAPIGAGGMGEVYRARDPRLSRDVALKVLPEHFADDLDSLQRFEIEAKAVATLDHLEHDYGWKLLLIGITRVTGKVLIFRKPAA